MLTLAANDLSTLGVAAIVACASAIAPVLLSLANSKARSRERKEDWAREDAVAQEAARQQKEVADEAARQQEMVANRLLAANERVATQTAEAAQETQGQLKQIHTLVNSNMTAQMEESLQSNKDSLIAKRAQLASLLELIAVKRRGGEEPSADAIAAVKAVKESIEVSELSIARKRAELDDRLKQTKAADAQLEQSESGGVKGTWEQDLPEDEQDLPVPSPE